MIFYFIFCKHRNNSPILNFGPWDCYTAYPSGRYGTVSVMNIRVWFRAPRGYGKIIWSNKLHRKLLFTTNTQHGDSKKTIFHKMYFLFKRKFGILFKIIMVFPSIDFISLIFSQASIKKIRLLVIFLYLPNNVLLKANIYFKNKAVTCGSHFFS